MKRYRIWILSAFVVVTALLVGATLKVRQNELYQLSRYPRTPAFDYYLFNLAEDFDFFSSSNVNVRKSWFQMNEPKDSEFRNVKRIEIPTDGRQSFNNGVSFNLTAAQLNAIKDFRTYARMTNFKC